MKSINTEVKTMKTTHKLLCGLSLALAMIPGTASAILLHTDRASWEAAATGFTDVDIATQVPEYSTLTADSSLDLGYGESVSFGSDLIGYQVGSSWATWSDGETPAILYSAASSLTATFDPIWGIHGLGFELEPEPFQTFTMTMDLIDGSSLSQDVDGYAGATFFGWTFDGGPTIASMTISCAGCDFAIGRMVTEQPVPEPGMLALMSLGILGFGVSRRMKTQ